MRQDVEAVRDQLLHAAGEAVTATDATGRITYWNAAAARAFGWSGEEVRGRVLRELVMAPDDRPEAAALWASVIAGDVWSGRLTLVRRDQSPLPAQVTASPFVDAEGAVVGVITVIVNLADRAEVMRHLHRVAAVVDAFSDGVVIVDLPAATVEYVDEAGRRLLHAELSKLVGQPLDCVLPLTSAEVAGLIEQVGQGRVWRSRVVADEEGELPQYWDVTATAVRDEHDITGQVAVTVRDVTVEVQSAERLRQSEARFRALVQRSADAALIADERGVLIYASPALREVFGFEPWEIEGLSGFDFVHPDDLGRAAELLENALRSPGPQPPIELRLRTADGRFIWTEETVSNQLHNPAVQGIVMNLRDISVRKLAELSLAASERRYRAIVDAAEEGIWVLDEHDVTAYANQRLERMLGLEPDAILGRSPLEFVHAEDAAVIAAAIAEQRNAARHTQPRMTLQCRFLTSTGSVLHVLIATHPFFDEDGRYRGSQGMFTDVSDLTQAQEQLSRLAVRDELTGLANRSLLLEHVTTLLESQSRVPSLAAALCVDLDGDYTNITDAFGHEAGDRLILEVAERLVSAARPGDIVGRFSAPEFVVLCADLDGSTEAPRLARMLLAAVAEPMLIGGRSTSVAATVGIAYTPAASAVDLLRDAAAAAHRAGGGASGAIAVFSEHLQAELRQDLEMLDDLRGALVSPGQLRLEYQPVMGLPDEVPVGVEALVRWLHPGRGLLKPDVFIPLAEGASLIPSLDRWVLHEATMQLARWRREGVVDATFRMSVNISGGHFTDVTLVEDVRAVLADSGIPAGNLVLEVTETAVVTNLEAAIEVLQQLNALGIGLAIDDFGTGYSSLAYLRRFPVDTLKIDRSFVRGLAHDSDDQAIVASTLSLARSVGMRCVAEGVETHEQLEVLLALGCDLAQGYLWSRAVSADDLPSVLAFPYSSGRPAARRLSPIPRPEVPTQNADIQRQILELHHAGASLQTIAAALNRHGHRTASGRRWHAATVARVIAVAVVSATTAG